MTRRSVYSGADALVWKERYEAGESTEAIALDVGLSISTVGKWLRLVETEMRGGNVHKPRADARPSNDGVSTMPVASLRPAGGHRRRGWRP
jgi:hypothetical protein